MVVRVASRSGNLPSSGASADGTLRRDRSVRDEKADENDRTALHALARHDDYPVIDNEESMFVQHFRQASPYIEGHRGKVFLIQIPGEVIAQKDKLEGLVQDLALLYELGVKLVLVVGAGKQINELLKVQGKDPQFHAGYRVTDEETMNLATLAAGMVRTTVEAQLSRGSAVPVLRRHGNNNRNHGPAVKVVSGNFITAKRRGVFNGIDYGETGQVRWVEASGIHEQLDTGHVILMNNLGFTAAGEVLNCSTYEVAVQTAVQIRADKMFIVLDGETVVHDTISMCEQESPFRIKGCKNPPSGGWSRLPRWLTLSEAEAAVAACATPEAINTPWLFRRERRTAAPLPRPQRRPSRGYNPDPGAQPAPFQRTEVESFSPVGAGNMVRPRSLAGGIPVKMRKGEGVAIGGSEAPAPAAARRAGESHGEYGAPMNTMGLDVIVPSPPYSEFSSKEGEEQDDRGGMKWSVRHWQIPGCPTEFSAAVYACKKGVNRCHLVDANVDGSLILELYTRDGVGTMVSSDIYEGMRAAVSADVKHLSDMLRPLELEGTMKLRSEADLLRELPYFTIVERDNKVLACAALLPWWEDSAAEVAAFVVHPKYRGEGRGDGGLRSLPPLLYILNPKP